MTEELEINGEVHIHTTEAARRLGITTKRFLDYVAQGRVEAIYLNGYYVPKTALKKLRPRKPGRPPGSTKKDDKKSP